MRAADLPHIDAVQYRSTLARMEELAQLIGQERFIGFLELLNQDVSELLMGLHNGGTAEHLLFQLRLRNCPVRELQTVNPEH